ncbi:MAG: NAD(+) kinase [Desulfitibacter sp. BRH_c19]|nr:MAG: NAD(+) kinase [Desulfitibacter sp. BRH_c19]
MKKIGFIVNLRKESAPKIAHQVIQWLIKNNIEVYLTTETADILSLPEYGVKTDDMFSMSECILVLGGDGTLLNTARCVAGKNIPLLGINLGQLGFLTELEVDKLIYGLEELVSGHYHIEERMMLKADVYRNGKITGNFHALNDIVITKGAFARMIEMNTYVDSEFLTNYPADGLIISSPTGSTAYSLSAGGPIVSPDIDVIIITPICPHTLYARPVIISHNQSVRVVLVSDSGEIMLTVDGQDGFLLDAKDEVIVNKSNLTTRLIKLRNRSFYAILREKLKDGSRNRE